MNANSIAYISIISCSFMGIYGCANVSRDEGTEGEAAAPVAAPQLQATRAPSRVHSFQGTVMRLDSDWFEVAPHWTQIDANVWSQDGKTLLRKTEYDNSKSKRISVIKSRVGGDHNCEPFLPGCVIEMTHRISDLQVGDVVSFVTGITREGDEWPYQLTIHRRFGGIIPPMYGDLAVGTPDAYHVRFQAEQDWEEKGVPIPKQHLNEDGFYWNNSGINPPYRLLPTAPPPRPVKP